MKPLNKHISSFKVIILGFFALIMMGALLLMLPFSTNEWGGATFIDALFTATSAACVTGLVVQDTATYWSTFGQFVIIVLIQIGGMGVVTVAMMITKIVGHKIGLRQQSTLKEAISAPVVGGVVRMMGFIYKMVFFVEVTGAVVLSFIFIPEFGFIRGVWYSIFHSISAFCNAGFDLLGIRTPFSSLSTFSDNPVLLITIMLLITVGGLGFFTWRDILENKLRFKKYRMQSKVVIVVSGILLIVPAIYFFFCEYSQLGFTERILGSFFQSVTARTAGFNSLDLTLFSETGIMVMIVLMLIGGSPGSTAGGIKTTTAAVLFSSAISVFRKKSDTCFYGRRIPDDTVKNAATILVLYIVLFITGGMVISYIEDIPMMTALFETSSAVATVGVTLGITPSLCVVSRVILIFLMFTGRVGGLTLIYAALSDKNTHISRLPKENITVG